MNYRKVKPGSIVEIDFDTMASATGAPITMTGLAVADVTQIKIYKDGSTTERASSAGFVLLDTDGIDFDGLTGIHAFTIDLANNTTAGFYTAGGRYRVVVTGLTVDGQTVRFTADKFIIGYDNTILDTTIATLASQTGFTITNGSADNDAYNGCVVIVHDAASAVQIAQGTVADYVGGTKTVTLTIDPAIFTMAAGDNISFYPRTNVYSIAGEVSTPAATVDANVVSIDTGAITAASLAADAGTEIAAAVVANASIVEVLDRLGFLLARQAGAVPNAKTGAPGYVISRSGNTFTLTLAGVTIDGVRTAPSLVKT